MILALNCCMLTTSFPKENGRGKKNIYVLIVFTFSQ
jgi:hypothetical protein